MSKKRLASGGMKKIPTILRTFQVVCLLFFVVQSSSGYAGTLDSVGGGVSYDDIQLQEKKTVKGVVVDTKGEPIAGANVLEVGTANGVITDFDGNFTLKVAENAKIRVSYVGYVTQEVKVGTRSTIKVVLAENSEALEEVVVVGYGKQKKVNLTGAVAVVGSKELVKNNTANVSSALSGRLAGLVTIQSSGEPGSDAASLRIRGVSSLNGNSPLILVDGVPRSMNNVNPNDIASISVLKDAAAAAIYGMRAANGVVLITTKRGKGKTTFNINAYTGIQTPTRMTKFLDSYNYAVLLNEAKKNDGVAAAYTEEDLQKFKDGSSPDTHPNTDWIGEVLSDFSTKQYIDLSASGSNETNTVKYFTSLGYMTQDALYKNNNFDRLNFRTNLDVGVSKNITLTTDFSGSLEKRNRPGATISRVFSSLYRTPPIKVNRYSNGGYAIDALYPEINNGSYNNTQNLDLQSKVALHIKFPFLEGLNLTTQVAYDRSTYRNKSFSIPRIYTTYDATNKKFSLSRPSDRGEKASLNEAQSQGYKLITEAILGYDTTLSDIHHIGAKLIYSRTFTENNYLSGGIDNITGTAVDFFIAGDASTRQLSNSTGESAILGYAGRFTYDYDERYLFEFNGRYDGSYKFSKNARFDFFPSFSFGWNISKESFFEDVTWMSKAKLRASYGELGSDDISAFRYLEFFKFGGASIVDGEVAQTIYSTGLKDDKTTWEKAKNYNLGIELGFLNNALTFEADMFYKRTSDILTTRAMEVPDTFGAKLPLENIGIVDNKGLDLNLSYRNSPNEDLSYNMNLNFSYAKNEVIDVAEPETVDPLRRKTGRPIGTRFGYVAEGLFMTQKEIDDLNAKAPGGTYQTQNPKPGDIRYKDVNGDGKVNQDDRTVIGKGIVPEITFGLSGGVNYKQFDFSMLLQGATNYDVYLSNESAWAFFNGGKVFDKHLGRAKIGEDGNVINKDASYPKLSLKNNAVNERTSSYWVQPGDYLRLKNIELGYTLPNSVLDKVGLSNFRIYVNARNLFTWSKIDQIDPENPHTRGWFYPQQKIYNVGLNVQF